MFRLLLPLLLLLLLLPLLPVPLLLRLWNLARSARPGVDMQKGAVGAPRLKQPGYGAAGPLIGPRMKLWILILGQNLKIMSYTSE